MTKRFIYVQKFEQYTDYESSLDRVEQGTESVRRVTLIDDTSGQPERAYLTMSDYTEKRVTLDEALAMLEQEQ